MIPEVNPLIRPADRAVVEVPPRPVAGSPVAPEVMAAGRDRIEVEGGFALRAVVPLEEVFMK
jgi:hypothetical protein